MKKKFCKYVCDSCKKESDYKRNKLFVTPEEKGWIGIEQIRSPASLFAIEIYSQGGSTRAIEIEQGLHFCSLRCLNKYFTDLIKEGKRR